jgi:lipoprotein-anchoring transpeptidase ErfK/SrfK
MTSKKRSVSRRDFLKLAGLGLGAMAMRPLTSGLGIPQRRQTILLPDFPQADLLGRNCAADTNLSGGKIELKSRPDVNSTTVRDVYGDEVFPWLKEVTADTIDVNYPNQRWVETPEGYIHSLYLQPCRNIPNTPLSSLPDGKAGFWGEVTIPYVDLIVEKSASVGWVNDHVINNLTPRLYYSQVMWIDAIRTSDSGTLQYHVNERYGNPGDLFWAEGAAFRPLTDADVSPINPDVDPATKKIIVNVSYQTLTCKEGDQEVYFCRVSTGVQDGSTPFGEQAIWRKVISIRMAANTVGGSSYDLPGISWTSLFNGNGVAIHGATSHNDFGTERSHGCVNCRPEDAKWVFRWSQPTVSLEPGLVDWHDWSSGSTHVIVEGTF